MKKLLLVVTMIGMVLAFAMPSFAQQSFGNDNCSNTGGGGAGGVPINVVGDTSNSPGINNTFGNTGVADAPGGNVSQDNSGSCNTDPTLVQDIDTHSGDAANNMNTDVSGSGNLVCNPGSQNGNSGNSVNVPADQQTVAPGGTAKQGDFGPDGIEPKEGGDMTTNCP